MKSEKGALTSGFTPSAWSVTLFFCLTGKMHA